MSRLILSAGVLITTVASLDAQEIEAPWQGELTRGPYTVGFRTESLERTTVGDASRELTLSVWYPATPGSGQSARLEDFFEVALDEGQLSETNDLPRARALVAAMTGDSAALPQGVAERALATATFANLDAEQADGRFPLALWSSRHATVLAQAPLSETLASHGIIIATVWTSDPPLAFIWEDHPENLKLETIAQQTADLELVLSRLRDRESVDPERTVVLAWSYGGQTAARLQERDGQIAGIVGLDANVVPARPEERLALRVPLIWLLGKDSSGRGLESASELTAPTLVIALPTLSHGNFNAMEGFLPGLYGAETVFPWSTGGRVAVDGYAALVRMTVETVKVLTESEGSIDDVWAQVRRAAKDIPVELVHHGSTR